MDAVDGTVIGAESDRSDDHAEKRRQEPELRVRAPAIGARCGTLWQSRTTSSKLAGREPPMVDYDEQGRVLVEGVTARSRRGARGRPLGLWWSFLLRGVLATALGLFALFWPMQGLGVLALAVGFYLVADGAAGLIAAWRARVPREYLVQPAIGLAIGTLLILWPAGSLRLLLTAFGLWVLVIGISQIVNALQIPRGDPERRLMMAIGIALTVLGLALALAPGGGLVVITWAIALAALVVGGHLILLGLSLKRLR